MTRKDPAVRILFHRQLAPSLRSIVLPLRLAAALCLSLFIVGCRSEPASGSPGRRGGAPTRAVKAPVRAPKSVWIAAVGDIMLDRKVGEKIKANGPASILARVRRQLRAPHLTFGNLECPLSTTGPHDPPNCCFRADPRAVAVLLDGGFDVVSLANNHALDAGRQGLLRTLDTLERSGIAYIGAHREPARSLEPTVLRVGVVRVGFIAFTDLSFEHSSYARLDKDPQQAYAAVTRAKGQCDLLFVSVHWGEEYESGRRESQRRTARALIDAGADCVLGHHPHTLQGIGVYKNKPILYSMGNFVFDQREGERMESALFELWWKEPGRWTIKATPVWISRERCGPVYPSPARARKIAHRLAAITRALGTLPTIEGSRVLVHIPQSHP